MQSAGNALPCRTADTWRAASVTDLPPDVVVSAGDVLFLAAVREVVFHSCFRGWAGGGEVLFPSCFRGWTADAAAPAVATVMASSRVAGAAARGASAADVLGTDCGHDHHRDARLSACLASLVHGLHLQSRFCRRPHGRRLTRGTGRSFSFVPTETSPREPAHFPGLITRSHLSSHTYKSRSVNVGSRCSVQCA